MSKTILLVNPPVYDFAAYDFFNKPLGLLYLGSILRQAGFNIRLIDAMDRGHPALLERFGTAKVKSNGTGKYHSEIIQKPPILRHILRNYSRFGLPEELLANILIYEYEKHKPLAVLVTSMMTYWYPGVADVIKLIRQTVTDTPVALGGVYARLMPEHARRTCRPDMIFETGSISKVSGWLDGLAGIKRQQDKNLDNFNNWPAPAYDLYRNLNYITLITSLGCPFNCDYCASNLMQPRLLQLEPDVFIEQMLSLLSLLDSDQPYYNIAFMDDALLARAESHIIPILRRTRELNLPLRFHCPNGLHVRFINQDLAELMYDNHFEMIRLSYESSDVSARWQQAGDNKTSDRDFKLAVECLTDAGYKPAQLEAYILTGLPGQTMHEIDHSAQYVHKLGLQVRLCQYSPIPGTPLFEAACRQYNIDPNEPLLHNNSILPALDTSVSYHTFQQFKNHITQLNDSLEPKDRLYTNND